MSKKMENYTENYPQVYLWFLSSPSTSLRFFFLLLPSILSFTVLKSQDTHAKALEIVVERDTVLFSKYLQRTIVLDVILPLEYAKTKHSYKVLYMNDGQDLERLQMVKVMTRTIDIEPFVLIAIHCGDRMQEYGTAAQADYKQRGTKAAAYTLFFLEELMPYIKKKYRVAIGAENTAICGFSLGGLSAFDIAWHHPLYFGKVGVFSGSFWWRQRAYENHYDDHNDRIMQRLVRESKIGNRQSARGNSITQDPQSFWFQTGTEDEKDDRNNNGVIDSIEDTLDLIAELEKKGYRWGKDIRYVEVKDGHHDQATWSAVMPDFLRWVFGKQ